MKSKILIVSLLMYFGVQAKSLEVKNEERFFADINKFEYTLVCFLKYEHVGRYENRELSRDIKILKKTIDAASDTAPFKKDLKREVGFLVVDVTNDAVKPLMEKYDISGDEIPQFLLFKNGKVVSSEFGEVARIVGFATKADLLDFIDQFFGNELDDVLQHKDDERQKERELKEARYAAVVACRYPYGGYAPYNYWGPYSTSGYAAFYGRDFRSMSFYLP